MKHIYILLTFILSASATRSWKFATNYAVKVRNHRPDLLVVHLKTEPVSLAVLGLTGSFDLKENMTNDYMVRLLPSILQFS